MEPLTVFLLAIGSGGLGAALGSVLDMSSVHVSTGKPATGKLVPAFAVAAVALSTANGLRPLTHLTLGDLVLLILGGFLVGASLSKRQLRQRTPAWMLPLAITLLLTGAIHTMASAQEGRPLATEILIPLFFFVAAVLYPLALAGARARATTLAKAFVVGATASATVAIAPASLIVDPPFLVNVIFQDRATGLTVHPNHLGLLCALALPFAVALLFSGTRSLARFGWTGSIVLLLWAISLSGSRAAVLGIPVSAIVLSPYLVLRRSSSTLARIGLTAAGLVVLGAVGVLLVTAMPRNIGSASPVIHRLLADDASVIASDQGRQQLQTEAMEDIERSPLIGAGYSELRAAHNIYLQVLRSGGAILLIAFTAYLAGFLRRVIREPSGTTTANSLLKWACIAAVVTWLAIGFVQNAIFDRYIYTPVAIALSLPFSRATRIPGAKADAPPPAIQRTEVCER